ncbi:reverse transcriptase RNA-dependent DNA polymerase [Nitzschia inconspicua]|uniref:Reverse transcriptase RNA-dependent DNA polymerase n=1 Tax=Nitzschia inconspicua TaxID=303405 RepID=A0A9K3KTJ1_9STRA|nr:reverse transcriptase RNA-dependent DNA polymerase [Nitzschia inconspicua]
MDDPFAASLLIDPTAIYTPSPMTQASPFQAPASPLRDEQGNDVSEDEASEDSETDEDDADDKHGTDPPPMQTSKRVTKTSLQVKIPGPDTSMRTMSTFACSPALATAGLINFETKEGQSLYRAAVEKWTARAAREVIFDLDSAQLGLDTLASASLTPSPADFIDTPVPCNVPFRGLGNGSATLRGTVAWHVADDDGVTRRLLIPNTGLPLRILSPQHLAQELRPHETHPDGTSLTCYSDRIQLTWLDRRFLLTVPLNDANVGIVRTVPSYTGALSSDEHNLAFPTLFHRNNEREDILRDVDHIAKHLLQCHSCDANEGASLSQNEGASTSQNEGASKSQNEGACESEDTIPSQLFDIDLLSTEAATPTQQLLYWHHRLNHRSFSLLKSMANEGKLPRHLASAAHPRCAACEMATAHRKPWRNRRAPSGLRKAKQPGQCISVDQLKSPIPGLMGQMKGIPTTKRFNYATVFVDHYSDMSYLVLQETGTADETLAAKHSFEAFARTHAIRIQHYHADNGRLAENLWTDDIQKQGQTMSYCGVSAHWQNGIAEKRIKDLQDLARTQLIHAKIRWPGVIDALFVLESDLQDGKKISKWEGRARLGVNLGPSPVHATNVSLVLNLETGHVSPQYHIVHDDTFETLSQMQPVKSNWKRQCHFTDEPYDPSIYRTADEGETATPRASTVHGHPNVSIQDPSVIVTSKGRTSKPPDWHRNFTALPAQIDPLEQHKYKETDQLRELEDPIVFAASTNPDIMYRHEAMKEPDAPQFREAMVKEVTDHLKNRHFVVIPRSQVPKDEETMPAVWAMRRKRRIDTREVYKWKARLNIGGHKMVKGKHYDETYAPTLSWATIRTWLTLAACNGWHTRQLDFVLAYPQADIPRPTYMELPDGIEIEGASKETHCLRVLKNIYGGKDAGRTWYEYLKNRLVDPAKLGFTQSKIDDCVSYRGSTVLLVYTDDCIIIDKESQHNIDTLFKELSQHFNVEDEGQLSDYLGVQISMPEQGKYQFTQPQLIDSILEDLALWPQEHKLAPTRPKDTPAVPNSILGPDLEGETFQGNWNYKSVIGKLNFLEKCTRPDISYAVHQCARYMAEPKQSHAEAVKRIGRYLLGTREKGISITPEMSKGLECYVDSDFCGNWDPNIAENEPMTSKSRYGYIVKLHGMPVYWASKLHTIITLSTAESEYIALSHAARYVRGTVYLLQEINDRYHRLQPETQVKCRLFEDNSAAYEMAKVPKMRPQTRHINVAYHHFRGEVANGRLIPCECATQDMEADIFTKATGKETLQTLRKRIMGW